MPRKARAHQFTIRLSDEELAIRDALGKAHGIDGAGVMRQALLRWARKEGVDGAAHPKEATKKPR